MSRIARLNGAGIPQDPFSAPRTKLSYRPTRQSPPDEPNTTLPAAEPPKTQRRSIKDSPIPQKPLTAITQARSVIARTSTSSTDEMSETESHSRISSSSKTSTSRSSLSRSPTIPQREQSPSEQLVLNERVAVPTMSVIGTLRFIGQTKFKPGIWTGIELDLVGSGKNDGCVQGVRYFTCPPQTGLFIVATKVIPLVEERTETVRPPIKKVSAIPSSRLQTMIKPSVSKSTRISRTPQAPTPTATKSTATLRTSASKGTANSANGTAAARMPLPERPTASRTPRKPTVARISVTSDRSLDTSLPSTPKRHSFPVQQTETLETRPPLDLVLASLGPETNIDFLQGSPTVDCPKGRMDIDEQKRILELLEKTERENRQLNEQMRAKEIAWERLVSSKESFALMVEEKEGELTRLKSALTEAQDKHRSLQGVLVDKEETLAKNNRDDVNEEQYQRRIEKLERLVLELQTQATNQTKLHENQVRDHAGQIEKIRREVVESEKMIVTLEGECEELRRAGLETLNACQNTVHQIEEEKVAFGAEKDKQIEHLNRVIEDLRRRQSVLFGDDDVDYRDDENDAEWEDQRRRMEEQLELATTELENERLQVKHGKAELEKLRQQMAQQQITSAGSDERVANLKRELEKEVDDKRRLIEEADAAFEAQAKAEDENYEMKLSRVRMESELSEAQQTIEALQSAVGGVNSESKPPLSTQTDELQRALETSRQTEERLQKECERLQEISKQSEQECMRLMDELLQLEKCGSEDEKDYEGVSKYDKATRRQMEKLEKELVDTQHKYAALELSKRTEISQLSKDLADLEALVESKVFGEGDLEESLELERKRVADLEKQLAAYKSSSTRSLTSPVSPITRTSQSLANLRTEQDDKDDKDDIYCELCDETGHDIIDCHAYTTEIPDSDTDKLRMYCDNCDEHGYHTTENCPNQDETF